MNPKSYILNHEPWIMNYSGRVNHKSLGPVSVLGPDRVKKTGKKYLKTTEKNYKKNKKINCTNLDAHKYLPYHNLSCKSCL